MSPGFLHGLSVKRTHERATRRTLRFLEQAHARLLGRAVTLLAIALDAGNNSVFPCGSSTRPSEQSIFNSLRESSSRSIGSENHRVPKLSVELHFLHQHPVVPTKQQTVGTTCWLTVRITRLPDRFPNP